MFPDTKVSVNGCSSIKLVEVGIRGSGINEEPMVLTLVVPVGSVTQWVAMFPSATANLKSLKGRCVSC